MPNCDSPSTTQTKSRHCLRPYRSESQPITPRPVPLTMAFSDMAVATMPPAKPISLPNGTWKAIPKMFTPEVHSRQNHIIAHAAGPRVPPWRCTA